MKRQPPFRFCTHDNACGRNEVKSEQYEASVCVYLRHMYFFCVCLCLFFFSPQENFTASPTTVTVCLVMLSESVLLPPLFQSALRYLFMFISWNPGGNQGWLANKEELNCLAFFSPKWDAQAGLTGNSGVHSVKKPNQNKEQPLEHFWFGPPPALCCRLLHLSVCFYLFRRTRRPSQAWLMWMPPAGRRQQQQQQRQQPPRLTSRPQVPPSTLLLWRLLPAVWPRLREFRCVLSAARFPGPATRWRTTPLTLPSCAPTASTSSAVSPSMSCSTSFSMMLLCPPCPLHRSFFLLTYSLLTYVSGIE